MGISRLNRREWIETAKNKLQSSISRVSPGLTAGSGLKLVDRELRTLLMDVSPGLTAGSGLKHGNMT